MFENNKKNERNKGYKPKNMLDSMKAAIAAGYIGDSCGGVLEFSEVDPGLLQEALEMRGGGYHKLIPGQVTDDSEMSMCLSKSLAQVRIYEKGMDAVIYGWLLAKNYHNWFKSKPFDIGATTKNAVSTFIDEEDYHSVLRVYSNSSKENRSSLSNGALMRSVPLAVWLAKYYSDNNCKNESLIDILYPVILDTAITHPNHMAQAASCIYVVMLVSLITSYNLDYYERRGRANSSIKYAFTLLTEIYGDEVVRELKSWYGDAGPRKYTSDVKENMGYLKHGLCLAFDMLYEERSFEEVLISILIRGGDTDTNAAIAMPIYGALYGMKSIPNKYIEILDKSKYEREGIEFNSRWYKNITWFLSTFSATGPLLISIKNKIHTIPGLEHINDIDETMGRSNKKRNCQYYQIERMQNFIGCYKYLFISCENKEKRKENIEDNK